MITPSGAEALGWQEQTGSLTHGKSADRKSCRCPSAKPDFDAGVVSVWIPALQRNSRSGFPA
jgi:hypothetical protein